MRFYRENSHRKTGKVSCGLGRTESSGLSFGGVYASLTESTKSFEPKDFVVGAGVGIPPARQLLFRVKAETSELRRVKVCDGPF